MDDLTSQRNLLSNEKLGPGEESVYTSLANRNLIFSIKPCHGELSPNICEDIEVVFTKGAYDENLTILLDKENVEIKIQHDSMFDKFTKVVDDAVLLCSSINGQSLFTECISQTLFATVGHDTKIYEEAKYSRDLMSDRLRNYTCQDVNMDTSSPISSASETVFGKSVVVDTMLHMNEAKIWVVHDFVSDSECDILMNYATGKLVRATVSGEGGKAVESASRRAQQAGYEISGPTDPLW